MVNDPNADTEFNDALRARGILRPKPPSRPPSPDIPHITHAQAVQAIASTSDITTLDVLLDGDGLDSDDERMFEEYKRKRMVEMRTEEKKGRFGSMMPLGREDFVKEVTEGSKVNPEGEENGTGVVVFLFKDSIPLSQHLRPLLNQLASAHPSTKFLSIPGDLCIPNYPDKNIPTLLIYRNGDVRGNVIAGMGLKGTKTTVQELEALLIRYGGMEKPSAALRRNDDDDSDYDDRERVVGTVNARPGGLRQNHTDSDSDLDM